MNITNEEKILSMLEDLKEGQKIVESRLDGVDTALEDLKEGQTSVENRLDGIDKLLDGMDKRLGGVDKRLDGMDKRLDGVDKRLDGMDTMIEILVVGQRELKIDVNQLKENDISIRRTLLKIENEQGDKLKAVIDGQVVLEEKVQNHEERLNTLENASAFL